MIDNPVVKLVFSKAGQDKNSPWFKDLNGVGSNSEASLEPVHQLVEFNRAIECLQNSPWRSIYRLIQTAISEKQYDLYNAPDSETIRDIVRDAISPIILGEYLSRECVGHSHGYTDLYKNKILDRVVLKAAEAFDSMNADSLDIAYVPYLMEKNIMSSIIIKMDSLLWQEARLNTSWVQRNYP